MTSLLIPREARRLRELRAIPEADRTPEEQAEYVDLHRADNYRPTYVGD